MLWFMFVVDFDGVPGWCRWVLCCSLLAEFVWISYLLAGGQFVAFGFALLEFAVMIVFVGWKLVLCLGWFYIWLGFRGLFVLRRLLIAYVFWLELVGYVLLRFVWLIAYGFGVWLWFLFRPFCFVVYHVWLFAGFGLFRLLCFAWNVLFWFIVVPFDYHCVSLDLIAAWLG